MVKVTAPCRGDDVRQPQASEARRTSLLQEATAFLGSTQGKGGIAHLSGLG